MGLFSSSKKEEAMPEWLAETEEIKNRMFVFFEKLEAKMKELCEAAIPELNETYKTDEDIYKRAYGRMLSGIKGQLQNIREKARVTYEEKVSDYYREINSEISIHSIHHDTLMDFRNDIAERHNAFDDKVQYWRDALDNTGQEDLEIKYQAIVDEFNSIKNKFKCKQCGGHIAIEKIYFITAFLTCPQCQTQNTFEPSTQARGLEQLGRDLAEQRTAHLQKTYNDEVALERTLYHEKHTMSLSRIHASSNDKASIEKQMEVLEQQRQAAIKNAPVLYQIYLRAMFDEWNKIVPDLTEQNNKFYDRILDDFMRSHS
jgi:hypothetical protein